MFRYKSYGFSLLPVPKRNWRSWRPNKKGRPVAEVHGSAAGKAGSWAGIPPTVVEQLLVGMVPKILAIGRKAGG